MRFCYVSDLHVDYRLEAAGEVARRAAELDADVLVVAGDVCPRLSRMQSALKIMAEQVRRVLFLPGNHDLWCVAGDTTKRTSPPYDSRQRYLTVLPERTEKAGATYLGLTPYLHGEVAFVGVTGWYDYSLRSVLLEGRVPLESYRAKRFGPVEWMDAKYFRWPDESGRPLEDEEVCSWMAECLEGQLTRAEAGNGVEKVVVVTHMLTHRDMVRPTGELTHDFVMAYLGSEQLGKIIDRHPSVVRVISGHVHSSLQFEAQGEHGRYTCETSPLGYPREYCGTLAEHVTERVRVVEV